MKLLRLLKAAGVRFCCTKKGNEGFDYEEFMRRKIQERKDANIYRVFNVVNRDASAFPEADEIIEDGGLAKKKRITVWCANDVLGMSRHPKVTQAVHKAIDLYGVGSAGARGICGTSELHLTLERELADFHGKEAAFISSSGFLSNSSAISLLGKIIPGVEIYSASENHASILQGVINSRAPKHVFKNGYASHLAQLLSQSDFNQPKIVVFESLCSMTGEKVDVAELCAVAKQYGALTFVDEVHAVGLYGKSGAGIGQLVDATQNMDLIAGSLAKALGTAGAYLAGSQSLIDTIRSYAPGFVFTTSISPMALAGALMSLSVIRSEEGVLLRQKLHRNVKFLKKLLTSAGLPLEQNDSHIIPVIIGNPALCFKIAAELIQVKGHYVPGINFPTVPKGQEKLRITPTPFHTEVMMKSLVNDIVELYDKFKIGEFGKTKETT